MVVIPHWHPSQNYGPRKKGGHPQLIVLHYTAMDTTEAALQRLCDPQHEVSAHYLISPNGIIWQMVDEAQRAWHAGAGRWREFKDVNSYSIGIELANTGAEPFPEPQMAALEKLLNNSLTDFIDSHGDTFGYAAFRLRDTIESVTYKH